MNIDKTLRVDLDDQTYANKKYNLNNFKRELSDCERIIIHCTATDSAAWNDPMACIKYDLGPNHISRSGCPTATYHFYINKQGNVYQLINLGIKTWNCSGYNNDSVAICINHGAITNNVTKEQYDSLIETIRYVFDVLDWSYDDENVRERIYFHRDLNSGKTCPGKLDKEQVIQDTISKLKDYGDNL